MISKLRYSHRAKGVQVIRQLRSIVDGFGLIGSISLMCRTALGRKSERGKRMGIS
jgi:hypothetical protein